MELPLLPLIVGGAALMALMASLWFWQRRHGDAGIVDVAWAASLGALAIAYAVVAEGDVGRRILLGAVTGTWGFRLAFYLLRDRVLGHEEDGRYQELRRDWGDKADRRFFVFFQAQALLNVLLSLSFLVVASNGRPFPSAFDLGAIALGLVVVLGQSRADRQLAGFRADPRNKGKVCRVGLWRYSRHPNYFFEWLHWWVYVLLAVGSPLWWLTLIAPFVMLFLVTRVTGIPPTEAQAVRSRGDAYREYQRTTSAFFPWFPRTSLS